MRKINIWEPITTDYVVNRSINLLLQLSLAYTNWLSLFRKDNLGNVTSMILSVLLIIWYHLYRSLLHWLLLRILLLIVLVVFYGWVKVNLMLLKVFYSSLTLFLFDILIFIDSLWIQWFFNWMSSPFYDPQMTILLHNGCFSLKSVQKLLVMERSALNTATVIRACIIAFVLDGKFYSRWITSSGWFFAIIRRDKVVLYCNNITSLYLLSLKTVLMLLCRRESVWNTNVFVGWRRLMRFKRFSRPL